jgi:transcriptional regulator with PAS, ATPase and Fis domain
VIAATNKNLFEEITKGSFRKDLFFRLNINSIELPPLRERKGDIELLAQHFLHDFNRKYSKNIKKISPSVISLLKSYSFPGNIRELMNIMNSAIIVESGTELRRQSLPNYFQESCVTSDSDTEHPSPNKHTQENFDPAQAKDLEAEKPPSTRDEIENEYIRKVLGMTHNNRTRASEILGISRVSLIARIKKYGL